METAILFQFTWMPQQHTLDSQYSALQCNKLVTRATTSGPTRPHSRVYMNSTPANNCARREFLVKTAASLFLFTFTNIASPASAALLSDSESDIVQQSAIAEFKQATQLQDLAFEYTNRFEFAQAEVIWTKLISMKPSNAAAYSNRGNCRTSQGKFDAAIEDFNKAIELAPKEPDPFLGKGVALEGLGLFKEAIDSYSKANAVSLETFNKEDSVAWNNKGNAYGALNEWEKSAECYALAASLDRNFVFAQSNAALALAHLGAVEESKKRMRFLALKYPSFADTHAALAVLDWKDGNRSKAETEWFKALTLDPRYKDIDWVKNIRRWPPTMVSGLEKFLGFE
mmetsp:Transcript_6290/g.11205  ORF Transcript_6290/g.11205 Transcript_6290/m.11205 type:complete len:341 (-) Transcript_6290:2638-3660(-)